MNKKTTPKNHWNYRVIAQKPDPEVDHLEGIYLSIHEVYYEDDKPVKTSLNADRVRGESIKDIGWQLNKMKEALKKPILCGWEGDEFLNEYRPN